MNDRAMGEGWWQASDGRWYPPEAHPDARRKSATPGAPGWVPEGGVAISTEFAPPSHYQARQQTAPPAALKSKRRAKAHPLTVLAVGLLLLGALGAGGWGVVQLLDGDESDAGSKRTTSATAPTTETLQLVCLGGGDPRFPALDDPAPRPPDGASGASYHAHPTAVVRSPAPSNEQPARELRISVTRPASYRVDQYQLVACVSETARSTPHQCRYRDGRVLTVYDARFHVSLRETRTGREVLARDFEQWFEECPSGLRPGVPLEQAAWAEDTLVGVVRDHVMS